MVNCLLSNALCSTEINKMSYSLLLVCLDAPPTAGTNMVGEAVTTKWVGAELTYTCAEGFKLEGNGVSDSLCRQVMDKLSRWR